jgi:hypothetical protein
MKDPTRIVTVILAIAVLGYAITMLMWNPANLLAWTAILIGLIALSTMVGRRTKP